MPDPAPPSEYDFLFKVTVGGRTRYEVVTAPRAADAVERLRAAGGGHIVTLIDDVSRHRFKSRLATTITPEAYAHALADSPRQALGRALLATLRKQWYVLVIMLVFIAVSLFAHVVPYFFILVLVVPYVIVLARVFAGGMHRRLQRLTIAARWADVAELAAKYPDSAAGKLMPGEAAKTALYFQTRALPRIGRLREALELVERRRGRPDFPEHLYWRYRGLALIFGEQEADAIGCLREAVAADGDDVSSWLVLAYLLAREAGTRGEAARILAAVRERPLTAVTAAEVGLLEGALAVEEGRDGDAIAALERALPPLEAAARQAPLYMARVWELRGWLAVARVRGGDAAAGRREFEAVRGKLELQGERRVLERYAAAVNAAAL